MVADLVDRERVLYLEWCLAHPEKVHALWDQWNMQEWYWGYEEPTGASVGKRSPCGPYGATSRHSVQFRTRDPWSYVYTPFSPSWLLPMHEMGEQHTASLLPPWQDGNQGTFNSRCAPIEASGVLDPQVDIDAEAGRPFVRADGSLRTN